MAQFTYKARNISGNEISGIIESENVKTAAGKLSSSGLFPIKILAYQEKVKWHKKLPGLGSKRISHKDVVIFTRRLADLLKGGLQLARALNVLANQTENPKMVKILKETASLIHDGRSLSQSLKNHPEIFPAMYTSTVEAGEAAGVLEVVLNRLADYTEKEEELRYRINSAMAYPAMMLLVGLSSVIFLLSFVIPKFEAMFRDMGQSLPLPTRILLGISHFLKNDWWLYLPLAVILFAAIRKLGNSAKGRLWLSNATLNLPVIGVFIKKDIISKFIRMLSILLSNGIPILDSLNIAKNSIDNRVFAKDIERIYSSVKDGQGLSAPVQNSALFPPMVSEMKP
jgi:type II secretory pathway component PulF